MSSVFIAFLAYIKSKYIETPTTPPEPEESVSSPDPDQPADPSTTAPETSRPAGASLLSLAYPDRKHYVVAPEHKAERGDPTKYKNMKPVVAAYEGANFDVFGK
jgi:hypothetical protein